MIESLLLAYPLTFLFFQGGQYCEPLCFEPTLLAVITLIVALFVLVLVAGGLVTVFRFDERGDTHRIVRWLVSPPFPAGVVLLGLLVGFVGFLTFDTLSLYEATWKPIILPLSFLLFLPVWVLYMASFPLSVLFSVFSIESSSLVTLVFRGVVVTVGFPISAVFQTFIVSAVVDGFQSEAIN